MPNHKRVYDNISSHAIAVDATLKLALYHMRNLYSADITATLSHHTLQIIDSLNDSDHLSHETEPLRFGIESTTRTGMSFGWISLIQGFVCKYDYDRWNELDRRRSNVPDLRRTIRCLAYVGNLTTIGETQVLAVDKCQQSPVRLGRLQGRRAIISMACFC